MKRFVWPLQRVLDIKTMQGQIKKAELLKLTETLAQSRGRLLMQKRILQETASNITKTPDSGDWSEKKTEPYAECYVLGVNKRLAEQEFFLKRSRVNDEMIKKLQAKIRELEKLQREKIAEVLKITRFKKGLEKLRERAKTEFIKEQEKLEQKQLNEIGTDSFVREIIHKRRVEHSIMGKSDTTVQQEIKR